MASAESEFRELKMDLEARGLFLKTHGFYLKLFLTYIALLASSIAILLVYQNSLLQILNVFLFSFALTQLGFIGHDMAHHQVFSSRTTHVIVNRLWWGLVLGLGHGWWTTKHNRHHANPNQIGRDPDIEQLFVFSSAQLENRAKILKRFLPYQHIYFFPLLAFAYLNAVRGTVTHFLIREKTREAYMEFFLQSLHFVLLFSVIFISLGFLYGAAFTASYLLLIGIHLGLTFAPNHKGMPIITEDTLPFYKQQVFTARNIKPNFFVDIFYGGLNYQVEHHLFSAMSRKHLPEARKLVLKFCEKTGIPYYETTMPRSLVEIYSALKIAT